jgi:hypothetical protein
MMGPNATQPVGHASSSTNQEGSIGTTNNNNEPEMSLHQAIEPRVVGGHRNHHSLSDFPQSFVDRLNSSQPMSILVNDENSNKIGSSSLHSGTQKQYEQQYQESRSKQRQRRGRSRRSNSDIPMAILEHGPYHTAPYPPVPPYYGTVHGTNPYPTWGYGMPPPPPSHQHHHHHHRTHSEELQYANLAAGGPSWIHEGPVPPSNGARMTPGGT